MVLCFAAKLEATLDRNRLQTNAKSLRTNHAFPPLPCCARGLLSKKTSEATAKESFNNILHFLGLPGVLPLAQGPQPRAGKIYRGSQD